MLQLIRIVVPVFGTIIFAGMASAQTLDESRMACRGSFRLNTNTSISACTALIESGQETEKDLARDFRDRGVHHHSLRGYDHEIEDYDGAIKADPNYAEVFYLRGDAYRAKRDYDRAIENYGQALSVQPLNQQRGPAYLQLTYYSRGLAYAAKGENDLAIQDFGRALEYYNHSVLDREILVTRAKAYRANGDYDLAIQDFDRQLATQPRDWCALYGRSLAYHGKGDEQQATEDFSRAASYFDDAMKFVTSRRPNLHVPQSLAQACGDKR